MARISKNSCDYFTHDIGMRNHKKIKAIRQKYGIIGYAIWCMILEYLTGSDGNVFEDTDMELELMSGDFGVSVTEIRSILDYCYRLELLFIKNGFVNSESLDERLKIVYDKRGRAKERSAKQKRLDGKFIKNNDKHDESVTDMPIESVLTVTEIPQSKVKESKVNISFSDFWELYDKKVGDKSKLQKKWNSLTDEEREKAMEHIQKYKIAQPDKKFRKDPQTYLNNRSFNDEIIGAISKIQATVVVNQNPKLWWEIKYPQYKTYEEFVDAKEQGIIDPFND